MKTLESTYEMRAINAASHIREECYPMFFVGLDCLDAPDHIPSGSCWGFNNRFDNDNRVTCVSTIYRGW